MAGRTILILGFLLLMGSCQYDLDVTGVAYTPVNVNERFAESMVWNNENPEREITVPADEYVLYVGSDSHVGDPENFRLFLNAAIERDVAAVFVSGDICTGREEDYIVTATELEVLDDIPVYITPGNHDLYFSGWDSYYKLFGPSVYTLKVHKPAASDLFIFLDTGGGTLGTDQLEWLENLLKEQRENHDKVVVVTHVNFFRPHFTNSTNPLNEELLLLIDLFEKHKVNMILQGHDHKRNVEIMGHSTYLILDALKVGTKKPSFLELRVSSEEIAFDFIDIL